MTNAPITSLINEWPNRRAMAADIGASVAAVHKWAQTGRIPADWQDKVVSAARSRGFDWVTPAWMLRVHNPDAARQGKPLKKQGAA